MERLWGHTFVVDDGRLWFRRQTEGVTLYSKIST